MALLDCAIDKKCCTVDGGRDICPFFSSPPRGICQLKSPHAREFAIQGKKNANSRGSARGGGLGATGIDWCITSIGSFTYSLLSFIYGIKTLVSGVEKVVRCRVHLANQIIHTGNTLFRTDYLKIIYPAYEKEVTNHPLSSGTSLHRLFIGYMHIYKLTKIVRALWLAERRVCMRVCKRGCDVKMSCFSLANHTSRNLKKVLSWKTCQVNFIYPFTRRLKLGKYLETCSVNLFSLELTFMWPSHHSETPWCTFTINKHVANFRTFHPHS